MRRLTPIVGTACFVLLCVLFVGYALHRTPAGSPAAPVFFLLATGWTAFHLFRSLQRIAPAAPTGTEGTGESPETPGSAFLRTAHRHVLVSALLYWLATAILLGLAPRVPENRETPVFICQLFFLLLAWGTYGLLLWVAARMRRNC